MCLMRKSVITKIHHVTNEVYSEFADRNMASAPNAKYFH